MGRRNRHPLADSHGTSALAICCAPCRICVSCSMAFGVCDALVVFEYFGMQNFSGGRTWPFQFRPQQSLYFPPEPQVQGSLRPCFPVAVYGLSGRFAAAVWASSGRECWSMAATQFGIRSGASLSISSISASATLLSRRGPCANQTPGHW